MAMQANTRSPEALAEAGETRENTMLGGSIQDLLRVSARVAVRNVPVLVTGETGVGKEMFVRRLHELSGRRGPLQVVNCAAMSPELVEGLLFGHERGAFTGADRTVAGLCEKAHQGTLFLDEVGELSERGQAALLRVLQEGRLLPVGSTVERAVDVRIVSATHRDLEAQVADGSFRADLLYRLNCTVFHIPPLRERQAEIPALVTHFLRAACADWGLPEVSMSPDALSKVVAFPWPGNIRQLRGMILSLVAAAEPNQPLGVADLPGWLNSGPTTASDRSAPLLNEVGMCDDPGRSGLRRRTHEFEAALIAEGLRQAGGSITVAAKILGVPIRTLSYKVKLHKLDQLAPTLRGARNSSTNTVARNSKSSSLE